MESAQTCCPFYLRHHRTSTACSGWRARRCGHQSRSHSAEELDIVPALLRRYRPLAGQSQRLFARSRRSLSHSDQWVASWSCAAHSTGDRRRPNCFRRRVLEMRFSQWLQHHLLLVLHRLHDSCSRPVGAREQHRLHNQPVVKVRQVWHDRCCWVAPRMRQVCAEPWLSRFLHSYHSQGCPSAVPEPRRRLLRFGPATWPEDPAALPCCWQPGSGKPSSSASSSIENRH